MAAHRDALPVKKAEGDRKRRQSRCREARGIAEKLKNYSKIKHSSRHKGYGTALRTLLATVVFAGLGLVSARATVVGALGGVGNTVGGTLGGVTHTATGTLNGVVNTVDGTLGGVTHTVSGTLNGVVNTVDGTLGGVTHTVSGVTTSGSGGLVLNPVVNLLPLLGLNATVTLTGPVASLLGGLLGDLGVSPLLNGLLNGGLVGGLGL